MDKVAVQLLAARRTQATNSIAEISKAINNSQNTVVEIHNNCSEGMTVPHCYCDSGNFAFPLPACIRARSKEVLAFTKTLNCSRGTAFVFSYKVDKSTRLAILVSVPNDSNHHENWFGACFMKSAGRTDRVLYNKMYYNTAYEGRRLRASDQKMLTVEDEDHKVEVTMSPECQAKLKVCVYGNKVPVSGLGDSSHWETARNLSRRSKIS